MAVTTTPAQPAAAAPKRFAQKPPAKKSNSMMIVAIVAGVVALALGAMAFMMFSKSKAATAKNTAHVDNLSNLATVFDLGGKATWTNAADIDAAWKAITDAATTKKGDLATAQEQLAAAQARAGELQTLLTTAEAGAAEAQKLKTQVAQAGSQAGALGASLSNRISQLETELKDAKGDLAKAEEQIVAFSAAAATAATVATAETGEAATAEPTPSTNATAEAETAPAANVDNITFKPETSELMKKAVYNETAQTMRVTLLNDKVIDYQGITKEAMDGLQAAPLTDVYFRMKIMGLYPSTPADVETIVKMTTGH